MEKLPKKLICCEFSHPNPNPPSGSHVKIPLYVDMNVGIGGDIWPAAQLFCQLITSSILHYQQWKVWFTEKSVLELGSGNGLISILLDKLYPDIKEIVISDINDHLSLIKENVEMNKCLSEKIRVKELNWFDYESGESYPIISEKFDIILALEW